MNNDRAKQCSVLCRFVVKDDEKHVPKLNDLVEVIGPIDDSSSVEALAVFSQQQQSMDDALLEDAIQPIDSKEEKLSTKLQPRKVRSERASNQTTSQSLERHNVQ